MTHPLFGADLHDIDHVTVKTTHWEVGGRTTTAFAFCDANGDRVFEITTYKDGAVPCEVITEKSTTQEAPKCKPTQ